MIPYEDLKEVYAKIRWSRDFISEKDAGFLYKYGDKLILNFKLEFNFDWIKFREMLTEDMNNVDVKNIIILWLSGQKF